MKFNGNDKLALTRDLGRERAREGWAVKAAPADAGIGISFPKHITTAMPYLWYFLQGWAAEWHRGGEPSVVLDEYDAQPLATADPPAGDITTSHRCFGIVLHGEAVSLHSRGHEREPVNIIMVVHYPDRWSYVAHADTVEYSQAWTSTDTLRDAAPVPAHSKRVGGPLIDMSAHDRASAARLNRIVLNVVARGMLQRTVPHDHI